MTANLVCDCLFMLTFVDVHVDVEPFSMFKLNLLIWGRLLKRSAIKFRKWTNQRAEYTLLGRFQLPRAVCGDLELNENCEEFVDSE